MFIHPLSYREMPTPDAVLTKLESAYLGADKRYDAVFLYEETVWNRVLTEQKLHSVGFSSTEVIERERGGKKIDIFMRLESSMCSVV
jgi:hypothetical protein